MGSEEYFEEDYENLNDAVFKAIVSSKEVQKILAKIKEQDGIDNRAVLNLFLSLDELYEVISEKDNTNSNIYKLEPAESSLPKEKKNKGKRVSSHGKHGSFIDGKSLTLNETLFENYCQGKFNEEAWKKKARIRI